MSFTSFFRIFRPSKVTQCICSKSFPSFAFPSIKFIFFKQIARVSPVFSGYFGPVKSLNVFVPKVSPVSLFSPLNSYSSKESHEFRHFFGIFRPSKVTQCICSKSFPSFPFLSTKFIFFKQIARVSPLFSGYFGPVKSLNVFVPKVSPVSLFSPLNSYSSNKSHEFR